MFYISYPTSLAKSLLIVIPKKGDLSLPKNYRGIQMLKAIAALYDRIIGNRIRKWLTIAYEQTAFQKIKSTLSTVYITTSDGIS